MAQIQHKFCKHDEYKTPAYAVYPIMKRLKEGGVVWCPFDKEDSQYVKVLSAHGFHVIYSHVKTGQDFFQPAVPKCDYIVSNPPYIHPADEHLTNLTYEPTSALTDGINGLKDIEKIILGAPDHLNRSGFLLLEHGWDQAQAVQSLFNPRIWEAPQTIKDLAGNDRVTIARLRR